MGTVAATQIPKPSDEQAFERACIPLWRGQLKDPNVQLNARRGQKQDGVDLYGIRDRDPTHYVGIQCKLKGDGKRLTETEVRTEVEKALKFKPALREYFIVTTAPDDGDMHELARVITAELRAKGHEMLVYIWGWNTLEEKINENDEARKAFDPSFGPFSGRIVDNTERILLGQDVAQSGLAQVQTALTQIKATLSNRPGDSTVVVSALEAHFDADIDTLRELANNGKPRLALPLLKCLLDRVLASASGRILFRIKANIGSCLLALSEDESAAAMLAEAYDHAPTEPKAIANKAFSLLLQGRWQELLTFGTTALQADPANENLAGYLVQAARFDTSIDDPLDLVPDALKTSAAVAIGRVDFIRRRRSPSEWWIAAQDAVVAHPTDSHAIQFAAEAGLDEILTSESFQRTRQLKPNERARIEASVKMLTTNWDKARATDGVLRPEDAALCGNIIVGLHALNDMRTALEVARQGLALAPNDIDIISRAATVAIDGHDDALVARLLAKLPPGPDATVLGFRFHLSQGNWSELAHLYKTQAEHIPEIESRVIAAAGKLAAIKLAPRNCIEERIKSIAREVEDDPRASIVVADFSGLEGFKAISDSSFQAALKCIGHESHIASRMMVAFHAARRGDWHIVANLLDGHVALDRDSDELRTLASAFVNDNPIRQRALRFFDSLPPAIREMPHFLHAEALLHFNRGDLPAAESALRKVIEVQADLENYLALFSVLRRSGRDDEIKLILDDINLAAVAGTPDQKMHLAQALCSAGYGSKAIAYAYDVFRSAKNDSDAALGYFGLIIMNPDSGLIPSVSVVDTDTWVRLQGEQGESRTFLIEHGGDSLADGIFSPAHPTASAAMGLKVGETFAMSAAFGENRVWRVVEIKHKYLHALHDLMENFETRFPGANGLYNVTMRDGDIQPVLDQVRRISESNRKLADLYLIKHLPLTLVASHLGGDTVGFVDYVRSLNFNIETCAGTEAERLAAEAIIAKHQTAGAVLDTYTAWTAATMDAFDVLAKVFGNLVVPRSVIDELCILRDKQGLPRDTFMTIGWQDGQYIRQEHTLEDVAARRAIIAEQISKIEATCEVKPATAPDRPADLASRLTDIFGPHVLDAANLAGAGYTLVSEDRYFRQIAEVTVAANGVWLQTVFAFARKTGRIDIARYADLAVKLAMRRHSHVSIDAETLLHALKADDTPDLVYYNALTAFIGTKNAEMHSHFNVVMTFLNRLWARTGTISVNTMKATSIVLRRLIRHQHENWALILALVENRGVGSLPGYVDDWARGHFVSPTDFSTAKTKIAARRSNP
jgi:tetratricopeptide (TPR) repeat protein